MSGVLLPCRQWLVDEHVSSDTTLTLGSELSEIHTRFGKSLSWLLLLLSKDVAYRASPSATTSATARGQSALEATRRCMEGTSCNIGG